MHTDKDAQIVGWLGRLGAARAEHVMERFSMGRSWAYARLGSLVAGGLIEQRTLLYRQPGLYLATAEGLRWRGLSRLGVYRVGPGSFQHACELATVAVALHRHFPNWRVLSERELRVEEAEAEHLIASAALGELPGGRRVLHRPDLALIGRERTVAVEVEVSVKAPRRLAAICRGWARSRQVDAVYYLATPAAARALQRAVSEVRAEDRITVLPLRGVQEIERQEVCHVLP